ncbi:MAG: polysaccharide pyruvyl transferase family protein [Christensenellales bacterium]|nr:polysaccharide pyruvyl transferase family protein [Christensenellales bacterium]
MKQIMLYNHGGCGNRGCEAIVRSTAALWDGEAAVMLVSDHPEEDQRLAQVERIVKSEISPYSLRRIVNSVGFRLGMPREQEVARKYAPVVDWGKRSDVCLSIGGDTYCYGHQEHLQVINGRLKRAKKPMVLWGCSVEPDIIRGETLEDLRAYDLIVARESITEQAMQAAGLPVIRWCDPAFTMEREELPLPQEWREGRTVGLNVSPLILSRAKNGAQAQAAFVQLVRHILDTSDCAVALIPHVFWAHDSDMDALRAIKAEFEAEPRVFLLPDAEHLTAPQLKGYIARLCALVTARTHASVAAYSTAVPTLVIGYSVKARGIARDLFGEEAGHLIPVQELSGGQELVDAYEAMRARAQEERAFLETRLPSYTAGRETVTAAVMALAK